MSCPRHCQSQVREGRNMPLACDVARKLPRLTSPHSLAPKLRQLRPQSPMVSRVSKIRRAPPSLETSPRRPCAQISYDPCTTAVCEKNTPLDKKTGWKISFENTKSGAGLQLLLLGRVAKAHGKGVFFVHRHRYDIA